MTFGVTLLNWQPRNYNIVFTYAKANTNYQVGSMVSQITYTIPASRQLNYSLHLIDGSKTTTGLTMSFYANTANRFSLLATIIVIV
jgi:hypothetical protein